MLNNEPTPSLDEILVSEITRLLEAINIAKANPMSAFARDRATITVRNLQSLIKSESDRVLGEFVEELMQYSNNPLPKKVLALWRNKE